MNAERLKSSILQYAIQGKLVPQDPNDEPASQLLESVKKEKDALIRAGKIRKDKFDSTITRNEKGQWIELRNGEVKDISDEIPFEIPENWTWTRLGTIAKLLSGRDLSPDKYKPTLGKLPYITGASNFDKGTLIINRWTDFPEVISKIGDLLLTCKGTVGEMNINSIGDVHLARQVMALRPYAFISNKFIQLVLQWAMTHIKSQANSFIPGISRDVVMDLLFPLPPLAEQKRIVAKISELVPAIEEFNQAEQKYAETHKSFPIAIKSSILQYAIQGKLVPQDPNDEPASQLLERIQEEKDALIKAGKIKKSKFESVIARNEDGQWIELRNGESRDISDEIPFEIPESWTWCRVGTFVNLIMGQSPDGNSINEVGDGVEFHQGKIFFGEKYLGLSKFSTTKPARMAPAGSLLLCVRAPVGIVNVTKREVSIGRGLAALEPLGEVSVEFLAYWISIQKSKLLDLATGSTFVAVTVDHVKNLLIPIPSLAEQKRIVAKISEVVSVIEEFNQVDPT